MVEDGEARQLRTSRKSSAEPHKVLLHTHKIPAPSLACGTKITGPAASQPSKLTLFGLRPPYRKSVFIAV